MIRICTILLSIVCLSVGTSSQVLSQVAEVEPNDTCEEAQEIGAVDPAEFPSVTGSLDAPPEKPDVDFFRFTATPGVEVMADLEGIWTGQGTLEDPLLGLFDSDCNQLAFNDDGGVELNSRLVFEVPTDGVFVLAASSFPDFDFIGEGGSSGTYTLTLSPAPPPIGSIAGRIVDALTGEPLPGNAPPFAFAVLLQCEEDFCSFVALRSTDGEGRFRFERDDVDQPLRAGTYQIEAHADGYLTEVTDPFEVGAGEDVDLGDIALRLPPIAITDVEPCAELLPQGGTCRYSARVVNQTSEPLEGLAWSVVDAFGLGSTLDFTVFEASVLGGDQIAARARVALRAQSDDVVRFQFFVPSFVRDGAVFCAEMFLGLQPSPLVNTISNRFLFCIEKGFFGFEVLSVAESRKKLKAAGGKAGLVQTMRGLR